MERTGDAPAVTGGPILGREGGGATALPAPLIALPGPPFDAWPFTLLAESTWTSTSWPRPAMREQNVRWWLRHLVRLSVLGWTFVLVAALWELFAFAFSRCAGWGWDKGAFFFAWGLGVLAFGCYLGTSRTRPPVSGLFLAVNILVLGVLSLVVGTR